MEPKIQSVVVKGDPMRNFRRISQSCMMLALVAGLLGTAQAASVIGQPAPDFNVMDAAGHPQKLVDQKGKYVVLEWFNFGCPFIRKHYDSGNMQKLQDAYGAKGVVWYSVNSSASGKEGYADAAQLTKEMGEHKGHPTAILPDPKGKLARLYQAKTTPHMFIIDPHGVLIYKGALDSIASTDVADVPKAVNYVSKALDESMAGKPVTTSATAPYGCSVKY
jgi:peroxiredoxin